VRAHRTAGRDAAEPGRTGAGAEVTAAGVLSDVVSAASELAFRAQPSASSARRARR
jgi:hypothetical protein